MFDEAKFITDFMECYDTTNKFDLLEVFDEYFHIFISDNTNETNKSIVEHFFSDDEVAEYVKTYDGDYTSVAYDVLNDKLYELVDKIETVSVSESDYDS